MQTSICFYWTNTLQMLGLLMNLPFSCWIALVESHCPISISALPNVILLISRHRLFLCRWESFQHEGFSWKWRLITKFCFIPPGSQQAGFLNALKDSPARYPFWIFTSFHHVNVLSIGLAFSVTSSCALPFLLINRIPSPSVKHPKSPLIFTCMSELLKPWSDSFSLVETEVLFCWKTKCEFLLASRNHTDLH